MVDFVFRDLADLWNPRKSPYWSDAGSLLRCLLGIEMLSLDCWGEQRKDVVASMKAHYEHWAGEQLSDEYSVRLFARWLRVPAAKQIRLEAIEWIGDAAKDADEYWWRDNNLRNELALLVDHSWQHDKQEISRGGKAKAAFLALLKMLVDKQHPLAIDLQERIASGT